VPDQDLELLDRLEGVWASMAALGDTLTEAEWQAPTACPGWSVQDNYAHIIGIEAMTMGKPAPDRTPPDAEHVKNDIGRSNEIWVDAYRDRSGAEVLAAFREITDERLASLRAPDADLGAESWTPMGPGTVRDLLPFRVFDSWVHEQDVRRALDRPGGWQSAAAAASVDRMLDVMPMIVGKRVAPPEGTTVVFTIEGPVPRELAIGVVEGRARALDAPPAEPTARLVMDGEAFLLLASGRGEPGEVLASGAVTREGDADLGARVVAAMNFLF
jgi:uncharacterized protein (TIGR03083 family)